MKKVLLWVCFVSLLSLCSCGCDSSDANSNTEVPTTATVATQAPTKAPTEPPTEAPTEALTEEVTQAVTSQPESSTFSVTIQEPITEAPTEAPTNATTTTSQSANNVEGSWYLDHYEQSNGQKTDASVSIVYTFKADGTFTVNNRGNESSGKYIFADNTITYKADASGEEGTFKYDPDTKTIIDIDENSDMSAVFEKSE